MPADARSSPIGRVAFAAAALLLTALAAAQAGQLYAFSLTQNRLPLWDMAGHAWGGIELHQALRNGRPLRFLQLLNAQDKWPFGFSLLLLPFLWAGDDSFAAATLLPVVLFALTPALLLWAAREVDAGVAGWWSGGLAALLFLASPLLRVFAVLILREEAGVFFSLLAFCTYLRAHRRGGEAAWRLAGLAGLALFLIKYNYALLWAVAVATQEILCLTPERRAEIGRGIGRRLWPWGAGQGSLSRVAAVYFYALTLCFLLGSNIGYPLYAGLLVATVVAVRRWWRDPAGVAARWRGLPVAVRAGAATVILPLWIWCLSPQPIHPKEIISFLRNRAAGPPLASLDGLLYYPRAFVADYAPAPLGAAILVLFALALLAPTIEGRGRRFFGEAHRVLLLTAGMSFLLATLHPYKASRFLATAVPFVLLAATGMASRLAQVAVHFLPSRLFRAVACAAMGTAAAAGIVMAARDAGLPARLARDYALYSADPVFGQPLDLLAAASRGARRLAVIGSFNELSENLIRCRLAQLGGPEVTRSLARFDAGGMPPAQVAARVKIWLLREHPDRIAVVRLLPGSPLFSGEDYHTYNAWQLAAVPVLAADPALRIAAREQFAASQLEILIFEMR
jgi:hypothetical protein